MNAKRLVVYFLVAIALFPIASQVKSAHAAECGLVGNWVSDSGGLVFGFPVKLGHHYTFFITPTSIGNIDLTATFTSPPLVTVGIGANIGVRIYDESTNCNITIPGSFVMRTITCNTPVYTQAGGVPDSSGAAITSGQSWYINANPVTVGKTKWTEVFVGGYINGFIPTACVGGKPAGYGGS